MQVEAKEGPLVATAAKQGPLTRQVFISHTGQDQGARNFAASVLKPALEAAGLPVYMDFANLEPGCEWPVQLVEAAANSAVVVVVLSKQYTHRYWCMLELDLALHSHSLTQQQQYHKQQQQQQQLQQPLVIPVFYDDKSDIVKPDEIKQYWQHNTPADRREWVDPQRWADNIHAMKERLQFVSRSDFVATKNADYQLARRVVATAVTAMPVTLDVEGVLGAEEQEARLIAELVVPDPDRLGLWLHGCGGLGKTTIARLLYNRLQTSHFQHHHAFVELKDDADISSQQLSDVLSQLGAMGFQQGDSAAGRQILKDYVQNKTVLLVVDNVWTAEQLDSLLPRAFGPGSRVIITSRSSEMPSSDWWKQVKQRLLQRELGVLSEEAARALFRHSAGLDLHSPITWEDHRDAEKAIVKFCGGLPLALKLTGSLLECKEPNNPRPLEHWEAALEALHKGLNAVDSEGRLKGILAKSFDGLQKQQQHMFLDVATVLRGQPKHLALAVWRSWHGTDAVHSYEGLERCNLINTDGKGLMQLHDVLAALGRGILLTPGSPAEERYYGSRVWMQGSKLMGLQQGHPVLAAQLDHTVTSADLSLTDWSKVRILLMGDDYRKKPAGGEPLISKKASSPDLLWLQMPRLEVFAWQHSSQVRWVTRKVGWVTRKTVPCGCLPGCVINFLSGCCGYLHDVFAPEHSAIPSKLCILQLYFHPNSAFCKLRALTNSLVQLATLQYLVLSDSRSLTRLPGSLGQLGGLQHLDLSGCRGLTSLPTSLSLLSGLQLLNLSYCTSLISLPESLGQLSGLQLLNMSRCDRLACLPASLGQLSSLQQLDLTNCCSLTSLPESLGQLSSLQQLDLEDCCGLTSLPESLGQLSSLRELDLDWCSSLTSLPESLSQLSGLQQLYLSRCRSLTSLPESLGQLSGLRQLDLSNCYSLTRLPESLGQLSGLRQLYLSHCYSLTSLPESLGQLSGLQIYR